ncbi:hypothetical protein [Pseudomonas aeruginosa]|uniref:hypothetical protein n=1 Tax=Pseudomonas aeruginosa TaxID=287 RepID=UPI0035CD2B89
MKILIYSDLHTEFSAFIPPATDADLVILTGDIVCEYRHQKRAVQPFYQVH